MDWPTAGAIVGGGATFAAIFVPVFNSRTKERLAVLETQMKNFTGWLQNVEGKLDRALESKADK